MGVREISFSSYNGRAKKFGNKNVATICYSSEKREIHRKSAFQDEAENSIIKFINRNFQLYRN